MSSGASPLYSRRRRAAAHSFDAAAPTSAVLAIFFNANVGVEFKGVRRS
jgi:hypothetical protein